MIRWEKEAVEEAERKRKESDPCGENIPEPPITRWEQEERKSLLWSPFKTEAIRDSLLKGTLERLGHWGQYHYMGFHTTDKDCQIYDGESAFLAEEGVIRAESTTFKGKNF
jgi:hypothetical protein